jgi:hypothetical protein
MVHAKYDLKKQKLNEIQELTQWLKAYIMSKANIRM